MLGVNLKQAARALQAPEAVTNKFSRSANAVIRVYDEAGNERMRTLSQRDAMGAARALAEASLSDWVSQ